MMKIRLAVAGSLGVLVLMPIYLFAATVSLPQTGQQACWSGSGESPCVGTGQDGDLRAGGVPDEAGARAARLLDYLAQNGHAVAAVPLAKPLPDADDEPFLEVALSGQADFLVTGNMSHFPKQLCTEMNVLSPADFMALYKKDR
jgi:hypothetical protein